MTVTDKKEIHSPDIEAYQAMKLLEEGDIQAAVQKCMEAIERFGDNRNCFLVKARAHIEGEEYGFAEESLKNVLRLDPEHPAAWAMMGEVYFRLGNETRVDYCRSRLESIFPAITESLASAKTGLEIDGYDDGEREIGGSLEAESIVPLENVTPETAEPETIVDGSIEPEQVISGSESERIAETGSHTSGLKPELFETATFADICISQGKYEKALNIYSRLLQNDPGNVKFIEKINLIKEKWDENGSEQVE